MAKKGRKSTRGQGELYDEVKTRITLAITPTGNESLEALAELMKVSKSELVERFARRLIPVTTDAYVFTKADREEMGKC